MAVHRRRVTIVGLGLIGGSLGMALRAANAGWEIVGYNRRHHIGGEAKKRGAIDRAEWSLPKAVEGAEVVVLAVPPAAMEQVLTDLAPHLAPGTVVTDVASTKEDILAWADRILPEGVDFVGGHPMAGKELAGIEAAEATLFRGAVYCILPGARCAPEAVTRVEEIARAIGAEPYYLDPAEHDSYVAAISHVPFISAAALVATAASSPSWRDMRRLAAGGFRDATRTASGDVAMHRDICLTNRAAIARWLDSYIDELRQVRDLLDPDAPPDEGRDAAVEAFFTRARDQRAAWLDSRAQPDDLPELPSAPTPRDGLSNLFFGRLGKR